MDSSYFSPDIQEFIRLLAIHNVKYLIVGGEAVIYYGYARLTGDIDFFYERTQKNTKALFTALKDFWNGDIPDLENYQELMNKGAIIQFGRPPNRVDLINDISGISFEQAWPNRKIEEIEIGSKKHSVYYIGLKDLIKNKQNAKRYKDLEDLKYLTSVIEKK
ncbi:MAG: nucleotidyltransferase [Candidatus Aminicenantes bacterium]|nr:nucleotidyltransferase [Candidatus Aminicenantes bacterium]